MPKFKSVQALSYVYKPLKNKYNHYMQKKEHSIYSWIVLSLCFLVLLSSIIYFTQNRTPKTEQKSIVFTDVGFDTPVQFSATCTQSEFEQYSKIVKQTFKQNNKRFDQYHEYKNINNIYTLNHKAYDEAIQVDDILLDCLQLALQMQTQNSKFDITQGNVLNLWHDARENEGPPPSDEQIQEAMKHIDKNNIQIEGNNIRFLDPDLSIDLGGIAKGYTAKLAKEKLNEAGLTNGYINAGGNVVLLGKKTDNSDWIIGIQNPDTSESIVQYTTKEPTCMVTSGDYQRYFTYDGKTYGHIIDPDTGYPAQYVRSVTVITKDSGKADALSTTLFCMSIEDGKKYIESLDYDVQAIWIIDQNADIDADLETNDFKIIVSDAIKDKVQLSK